jgi:serpin B
MEIDRWPRQYLPGAVALALFAGLAGPRVAAAEETPARDAANAGAALGVDLYRLIAPQDGNVFISPYSISEAIALLSAGADGKTKQEVLRTLHWTTPSSSLAGAFGAQDLQLDRAAHDGAVLTVANGLWYQRGHVPLTAFLETAQQAYRAEVRVADFSADLPVARHMINYWVNKKTEGKIPELLPAGALTPFTRLVLANAIYFKGKWERQFKAALTVPKPFFTGAGPGVPTPTMTHSARFKIADSAACDLLELPYAGGELSMVILLPKTRDGLPSLEQALSAASLAQWLASLDQAGRQEVDVSLPRFKMSYSADLTKPLAQLGMATAFSERGADFSRINGQRDLYVSGVLHKAFVDVNEEGTEAAAATGIVVTSFAVEMSRKFTVDHPFLFLIRNTSTGSLLFLGRIVDPRTQ